MASTTVKYLTILRPKGGMLSYLQSLGAVLLMDGTLDGAAIKNFGSAGSALNGTATDITIDANGMNFNGTTSAVTIASATALSSLTDATYLMIAQAAGIGENNSGRLWNWDNVNHLGATAPATAASIVLRYGRATTAADTTFTNLLPALPSQRFIALMEWNGTAGTIEGHAAFQGAASYTAGTNSNGTGAVYTGTDLYIGNRQLNDRTWNGYISLFAIIPRVLTTDERAVILAFFK